LLAALQLMSAQQFRSAGPNPITLRLNKSRSPVVPEA
jgi:hypothetical protein